MGQTLTYTDFADRSYFALRAKNIDAKIKNYAEKLGVGLIHIKSKKEIRTVLNSKNHYSDPRYILNFLYNQKNPTWGICNWCKNIFQYSDDDYCDDIADAILNGKIYNNYNTENDSDLYLCKKCVKIMGDDMEYKLLREKP